MATFNEVVDTFIENAGTPILYLVFLFCYLILCLIPCFALAFLILIFRLALASRKPLSPTMAFGTDAYEVILLRTYITVCVGMTVLHLVVWGKMNAEPAPDETHSRVEVIFDNMGRAFLACLIALCWGVLIAAIGVPVAWLVRQVVWMVRGRKERREGKDEVVESLKED